jgi:hypothetical protein
MAGGKKTRLATDFRDLLRVFVAHEVRFLVVGAYALAVLRRPRATGDLDVWIDATRRTRSSRWRGDDGSPRTSTGSQFP